MPIKLGDLRKETRTVTFAYAGEDVTVVYRPGLVTSVLRTQLIYGSTAYLDKGDRSQAADVLEGWDAYHADLEALLVSWDVLGDDGKPCQPTAALLQQFPQAFINEMVGALIKDQNVNPQTGKDSKDTSQPKG